MKTKSHIIILFVLLILYGCPNQNCVCPDLYAPVCGDNGKTYSNPCLAECDGVSYVDGECPVYGIGVVEYSGDTLCGFYISIFENLYKPEELLEEFKVHDKVVTLKYRRLNKYFTCDNPYNHLQEIQILEIDALQ